MRLHIWLHLLHMHIHVDTLAQCIQMKHPEASSGILLKTILSCTGHTSVVDQVVNALKQMEICNALLCCLEMVHNALQSMLTELAVPSDKKSLSTCMLLVHATSRFTTCKRSEYCLCRLLRNSDLSGHLAPARTTVLSFARTCSTFEKSGELSTWHRDSSYAGMIVQAYTPV